LFRLLLIVSFVRQFEIMPGLVNQPLSLEGQSGEQMRNERWTGGRESSLDKGEDRLLEINVLVGWLQPSQQFFFSTTGG
jgi:hypothetical protein